MSQGKSRLDFRQTAISSLEAELQSGLRSVIPPSKQKKALFSPLAKKVETVQNTPSVLELVEWKIMSSNYKNNAQKYTNFHSGVA